MKHTSLRNTVLLATMASFISTAAWSQEALEKLSIVVFGPPSLGAFLPPVIKQMELDKKHGLDIEFVERTPDAYTAQFNSGEFKLGGSAALLTVGLAEARGVKATYLFNLFDFWGAVVTSRDDVNTLADLKGKELAAAAGTTNYVMFNWFARQQGVDAAGFSVINTATPGLVGYAMADRAAAVQLWEPAYTSMLAQKPGIKTLDLKIQESWKAATGSTSIPYLGVAAHADWVAENQPLVPKLYSAYSDAAEWVAANPEEAAEVIGKTGSESFRASLPELIRNNDRLGMNVKWASEVEAEIKKVYDAGLAVKFLEAIPSDETIYSGNK